MILTIVLLILYSVGVILTGSVRWLLDVWKDITVDQILYQLSSSADGMNKDMIKNYLFHYGIWELLVIVGSAVAIYYAVKSRNRRKANLFLGFMTICFLGSCFYRLERELRIIEYIKISTQNANFIEDNYANPAEVKMVFPEKKRNLIYIYLESMELTYMDKASGGAFDQNVIPELAVLAEEGECFAGNEKELNGGVSLTGSTWTMGAMFAQSTGLPLKVLGDQNIMSDEKYFYPSAVAIGDILSKAGYRQELMIGSEIAFGGRKQFFEQHGGYEIFDYNTAVDKGFIPADYFRFWGFEDEKLFAYAKDELLKLAEGEESFNFTLLTVDTHFEDGYICELCRDDFPGNQYANVFACSSRQVYDFVRWIQEQDFYSDTTIVISGDHPTMDTDFCNGVPEEYTRKVYSVILNSAADSGRQLKKRREYSTMDLFPTTITAMGIGIEGDHLGLGVNLYSQEETLVERYGIEACNNELTKYSSLMDKMSGLNISELQRQAFSDEATAIIEWTGKVTEPVTVKVFTGTQISRAAIDKAEVEITNPDDDNVLNKMLMSVNEYRENGILHLGFEATGFVDIPKGKDFSASIYATTVDGVRFLVKKVNSNDILE